MCLFCGLFLASAGAQSLDPWATIQKAAIESGKAEFGHWGNNPEKYSSWTTHSNRLIPVYAFGLRLEKYRGAHSLYRDATKLQQLYGRLPPATQNPTAEYFDQTDVYRLQRDAAQAGKKRIILMVFDGMDWHTTRAAAIASSGAVNYDHGRGAGLQFQDYQGIATDFGYFVTSPHNDGTNIDVNKQIVTNPGGKTPGGYDATRAGDTPWAAFPDPLYPIAAGDGDKHAYTDSASSATSLCAGIKTYNDAINVDFSGREVLPLARSLQAEGFAIGVVTSVPVSHATPACAYSNNVSRDDYQDLTRDLLGLPSVFHPGGLPGVDVLIGGGWGEEREKDGAQGENFVPGNRYLPAAEMASISVEKGGRYVVSDRVSGQNGSIRLAAGVKTAVEGRHRLFGYFGVAGGHLPYQTADGGYDPVESIGNATTSKPEVYSPADIDENPILADMAVAAADVLQARSDRWWLMVEAGDVDWANHSNNIDNSIGAVLSGDLAFDHLVRWIESHGGWDDTVLLLTADHGHYLVLDKPQALVGR
ncbi:MAG: alkaline phosphatase [Planctomycetales bacterium]|nr:alkaline phosphatase [Planctomycetales bacterium]